MQVTETGTCEYEHLAMHELRTAWNLLLKILKSLSNRLNFKINLNYSLFPTLRIGLRITITFFKFYF